MSKKPGTSLSSNHWTQRGASYHSQGQDVVRVLERPRQYPRERGGELGVGPAARHHTRHSRQASRAHERGLTREFLENRTSRRETLRGSTRSSRMSLGRNLSARQGRVPRGPARGDTGEHLWSPLPSSHSFVSLSGYVYYILRTHDWEGGAGSIT